MIDVGLAALSLAAVNAVGVAPTPRQAAFSAGDAIAFPLFAIGITLLCVVVGHGRLRWWTDSEWIGYCAAGAVASIALYTLVELNRERPMLDLRWLAQPFMLRFIAAVLLFRIVLSEQTLGMVGLMNVLGLTNDQMHALFGLVFGGMAFGFVLAIGLAAVKLHANLIAALAAGLIAAAAWMESDATALTRPSELMVTQALLGIALGLFFAASVIAGFGRALAEGGDKIVTFVAAYAFAQYFGALLGPAWLGTYVAEQQERHYSALAQHISLTDPQVAERLAQLGGSVARFVTDPAGRAPEGAGFLVQQTGREAYVLAYNDLFQIVAAIAASVALWLVLTVLRAPRVSTSPSTAHE